MKNFNELAQDVWAAKDVSIKRAILNDMVDMFDHPKKANHFREMISKANAGKCDFLAKDLALNDTDKVIK